MSRLVHVVAMAVTLATVAPAAAQEPPDIQRLEELRLRRMQEALSLSEEQLESLRSAMEEVRDQNRGLLESERESMERLREELRREPVDETAIARALASVEERRAQAERLRTEHRQRLADVLGPEQRARFLLFNHHFDSRLRELIDRRRAPEAGPGRPGYDGRDERRDRTPRDRIPGVPGNRGGDWLERRLRGLRPGERRQAIERLRGELDRLEQRLEAEDRES